MPVTAAGAIRSDEVYSLAELKRRTAWGDSAIRSARKVGLQPVYLHGRVFYRGIDVVAYIDRAVADDGEASA